MALFHWVVPVELGPLWSIQRELGTAAARTPQAMLWLISAAADQVTAS